MCENIKRDKEEQALKLISRGNHGYLMSKPLRFLSLK